jgi:hypothetical protein
MNVRRTVLSLAVLGLGLAPFSFGQFASPRPSAQRVLGYFDPATGIFQPLNAAPDAESTTATTTETGELIVKFTINVKSAIPKNGVIGCSASAETGDTAGTYGEHASGIATLVSGTTYTCSAIMHYSWVLATPTTDTVGFSGNATIDYGYQATATNGTAVVVEPIEARGSSPSIPSLKAVPANGLTTTINVSVTL